MSDVSRALKSRGLPCDHAYPAGEFCPLCGEVPVDEDLDMQVLGRCIHDVDLDREFCPEGCRV